MLFFAHNKRIKTTLIISIIVLFFCSEKSFAQELEIRTGPFIEKQNYIPQTALKTINGIIPLTHFQQCGQSWSSDTLGAATCSSTICQQGCAMTCAAMLLTANGVNTNPGQLNAWLKNNAGYTGCSIYWTAVDDYPGSTMEWYGFSAYDLSIIKSEIDAGNPVLAHVEYSSPCSHFVLVYGYNNAGADTSDYLVADPATSVFPKLLSDYNICPVSDDATPLRFYHHVSGMLANDDCAGAIPLNVYNNCIQIQGSNINATSSEVDIPPCDAPGNVDVWYSAEVPANGILAIEVENISVAASSDFGLAVYASCNDSIEIQNTCIAGGCGYNGWWPCDTLDLSDYALQTVYLRIWDYGYTADEGDFYICAYSPVVAGMEYADLQPMLRIYPNPVSETFYLDLFSQDNGFVMIEVTDVFGKTVFQNKFMINPGSNLINGSFGDVPAGVYFLKLFNENYRIAEKLIKE